MSTAFTPDGRLAPSTADDPIADATWESGKGLGHFTYRYGLDAHPLRPDWTPTVDAKWKFMLDGKLVHVGSQTGLQGWSGTLRAATPILTGRMEMRVELEIRKGDKVLRTERRTHTVYMLHSQPVQSHVEKVDTLVPKTYWLDKAFEWGAGNKVDAHDILHDLTAGIYQRHPASWIYQGLPPLDAAVGLLEGKQNRGQCMTFEEVWAILAASMGIPVGFQRYPYPAGFVTKPREALDRNVNAGVIPPGSSTRDRWAFRMHQWGTYGGRRYDPTFGFIGTDTFAAYEQQAVFCKVDPKTRLCVELADPALIHTVLPTLQWTPSGWPVYRMLPAPEARQEQLPVLPGACSAPAR